MLRRVVLGQGILTVFVYKSHWKQSKAQFSLHEYRTLRSGLSFYHLIDNYTGMTYDWIVYED